MLFDKYLTFEQKIYLAIISGSIWIYFRTLGCYPLTGAVESNAETVEEIVQEMLLTTTSERQGRVIDGDNSSMEDKKKDGYF